MQNGNRILQFKSCTSCVWMLLICLELVLWGNKQCNCVRFHLELCPYSKNICYNRVNDTIPVGTVGKLVTGSSGTLGLGWGSGTIGRSSSLGIVGAKIRRDKMVIQNDQLNMKRLFSMLPNGFWRGNLSEREHLEDLDIEWRIILRWLTKNFVYYTYSQTQLYFTY